VLLLSFLPNFLRPTRNSPPPSGSVPLTRKELYDLAERCRSYAQELARHEQSRVYLRHCHEFNGWLAKLKGYDRLARPLATLQPARPIARWQLMVLAGVLLVFLIFSLPGWVGRNMASAITSGYVLSLILFYFIPERLYGTTIELLEAKVLRVVDVLDELLHSNEMGLTEAAFFRIKENLETARSELREQIDLAHRRF
jgi:hypothetical protein